MNNDFYKKESYLVMGAMAGSFTDFLIAHFGKATFLKKYSTWEQTDLEKFKQFKNGDNNGYSLEKRFIRPDGSSVWTQMKVAPLSEWMNKKLIHLCLLEDITTRKEAEEALRLSEKDKSILLSNLPGMAFRCKDDCEWTVLLASDGCLELTGYSSEALT